MTLQKPISDALELRKHLESLDLNHPDYAVAFVRDLLAAARPAGASDIHVQPTAEGFAVDWRLDGVLHNIGTFRRSESTDVVVRLKVLAELLTYRTDVPQEGRIRDAHGGIEMRVSTFPTLYGERAVVRLFAVEKQFHFVADLGLPTEIETAMCSALHETSGALIISGPAGSGKTTTAYACLRELVRMSGGGKSIVSLEDPIEVPVDGVAQSQVQPNAGFDLATGLRSVMRQDPEVILVGEIRDRDTAETVFQAALTGHLVVTTFHAGSASEAVSRLSDMGIEPYLLRSGIVGILSQRLVRQLCSCALDADNEADWCGLQVAHARRAAGCSQCRQTGYHGRFVLGEFLRAEHNELGRAILSRSDAAELQQLAVKNGMLPCWDRAVQAVDQGRTSAAEVRRVFGFPDRSNQELTGPTSS